jgi:hypothetical protein
VTIGDRVEGTRVNNGIHTGIMTDTAVFV